VRGRREEKEEQGYINFCLTLRFYTGNLSYDPAMKKAFGFDIWVSVI
jgi:hypothetical protein